MAGRKRRIRVLLVDDHASVVQGIRSYFKTKRRIKIVGQAVDGAEAIQKARELTPDVVLMDLSLPKMNGLEALRRIRDEMPGAKAIAYTMHESREYVRAAMRGGAAGYVLKSSPLALLVRAIERVYGGRAFLDPNVSASFPLPLDKNQVDAKHAKVGGSRERNVHGLTRRERDILESLVDGLTIKEISERRQISYHTVVSHLRNIYNKFGVHKRSATVTKAMREHIV
jgi:DNA-binding NarL/FixJ family response regulator